ncbi:MAG: DNA cytosine methyltransferase, partial [Proteobacteria bacterium]|nr:DNA cytosine methyltransferase [Pseudomonadota bacterium]
VAALLARGLDRVLGTLAEIGYDAEWHCIPAAAVGAPHIRDRVFILAYSKSDGRHEVIENGGGCGAGVGEGEEQGFRHGGGVTSLLSDAGSTGAGNKARETGGQRRQPAEAPEPEGLRQGDGPTRTNGIEPGGAIVSDTIAERGWEFDFWDVEPDVGRVANGIPQRVDRLRGLGNAVVPQVAEVVGRIVMKRLGETDAT